MRRVLIVLILIAAVALAVFIVTYEPATRPEPNAPEVVDTGDEEVRLISWNLYNFGGSKSDAEISYMAQVLCGADLVAIQEVVTGPEGAQAVARLADALERMGAGWDYVVSAPTTGQGSERYAYLWKPSRIRLVERPWLEPSLAGPIDREPFMARFETVPDGRRMLVANLHAVPRGKDPRREIVLLDTLLVRYPDDRLIVLGDFNLSQSHYAFEELKAAGFVPVLVDQRTSLRMRRKNGSHLANEYDNVFYEASELCADTAGVIDFTPAFATLKEARTISDHLPVFMDVCWE